PRKTPKATHSCSSQNLPWPGIARRRWAGTPLCPSYPRLYCVRQTTWMPGTRPGMTIKSISMTTTPPNERPTGSVDPKLLEILVCPLTKTTLEYDAANQELISRKAKLACPIRDGIPIMLPEEARRLE